MAETSTGKIWRLRREDILPVILILIILILMALPEILGILADNPMLTFGYLGIHLKGGPLIGQPTTDPTAGTYTQALGHLVAFYWLKGIIPWWNPYSGVGLPLAGMYQPAAFFPLTLLLILPHGMLIEHILLQIIAGLGTYALLRHIGLNRLASFTGGLLFAFNGTLAWFDNATAMPVPFLPWILFGVERALSFSFDDGRGRRGSKSGGYIILAVSVALSLLAGFPEVTFIYGLFILSWVIFRFFQVPSSVRLTFLKKILAGGIIGISLSAPQLLSFIEYLPHSFVGIHSSSLAYERLSKLALLPSFFSPYLFGPIDAFIKEWPNLLGVYGTMGGYVDVLLLITAVFGFFVSKNKLKWLLLICFIFVVGKTFGAEPFVFLLNLVPEIIYTAFARYGAPVWEFIIILLSAFGIDYISKNMSIKPIKILPSVLMLFFSIILILIFGKPVFKHIEDLPNVMLWTVSSTIYFFILLSIFFIVFIFVHSKWKGRIIAGLLILDSIIMFNIPTLSFRSGHNHIDKPAIRFLKKYSGFERFFTLGPFQPDYGAYFNIASINHASLPVAKRWVNWIHANLNPYAHVAGFTGEKGLLPGQKSQAYELRLHLLNYEWLGVKYVIAPADTNPFYRIITVKTADFNHKILPLPQGKRLSGIINSSLIRKNIKVSEVGILQDNYKDTAAGFINIKLCSKNSCESGLVNLKKSYAYSSVSILWIPLRKPLKVKARNAIKYSIFYIGGKIPEGFYTYPVANVKYNQFLKGPAGKITGRGLKIYLRISEFITTGVKKVYSDALMNIYELPNPKPYFKTEKGICKLSASSRTILSVKCYNKGELIRRELFFPGWSAFVNGKPVKIYLYKNLFQEIRLNKGENKIIFYYSPPNIIWAWIISAAGLIALVFSPMFIFFVKKLKLLKKFL
jgi:hypothetical protein